VKAGLYKKNPIHENDVIKVDKDDLFKNNAGFWYLLNYEKIVL